MKKLTVIALAALFTASAGLALADGQGGACSGKKCSGHHWHKKSAKGTSKAPSVTPPADTNTPK